MKPIKTTLLTPGPTSVPPSVLAALSQPIVHHRLEDFQRLFEKVRRQLQWIFQTQQDVFILSASGTGGMEAAMANVARRGQSVLVLQAGKFGERWVQLAQSLQLDVHVLTASPGQSLSALAVEKKLDAMQAQGKKAGAVFFQASETSTGVALPTQEIAALCAQKGALSVVDAITALGVVNLPMDQWGIDVLITGSQKALMLPPGLAFVALSARAWKQTEQSDLTPFYFDLKRERAMIRKNQTSWTPAVSLIQGLHESLNLLQTEGLTNLFARHALLAQATRAGVQALGLTLLSSETPSDSVTAVRVPDALLAQGKQIPALMQSLCGITIVGGQDELEGKIFRLSHMGYCDRFDITTGLAGLELVLSHLGWPVQWGKSVGAALQIFNQAQKAGPV